MAEEVTEVVETPEPSWRDNLDAEIKDLPALADIQDVPSLAKSFLATKEMVGRKGIILPKEDDAADVARFRSEIGVPETVEGYDLGDFTPPEGLPWSESMQTKMLARLHTRGIPNGQIRGLFDDLAEVQHEEYQALVANQEQGNTRGTAKLKEDLGADYEASMALAERSFKKCSGDNFEELSHITLPDGTNLGDHPAFVKTFINIGKLHKEHELLGEKSGGGGFEKTPEQAASEMAELEKHPAYRNADDPEHKMITDKVNELAEMRWPAESPEVL